MGDCGLGGAGLGVVAARLGSVPVRRGRAVERCAAVHRSVVALSRDCRLDVVRAVAVLLVLGHHQMPVCGLGWVADKLLDHVMRLG